MKLVLLSGVLLLATAVMPPGVSAQESTNKPARALPAPLKPDNTTHATTDGLPPAPPAFQGTTRPMILPSAPALEMTNGILALDRETQEALVNDGAPEVRFIFWLTNVSPASLTITNVAVSCGCTAVELPSLPWLLKPGECGRLPVTLEVAGKSGVIAKSLQVRTDRGVKTIIVKADVRPPAETAE